MTNSTEHHNASRGIQKNSTYRAHCRIIQSVILFLHASIGLWRTIFKKKKAFLRLLLQGQSFTEWFFYKMTHELKSTCSFFGVDPMSEQHMRSPLRYIKSYFFILMFCLKQYSSFTGIHVKDFLFFAAFSTFSAFTGSFLHWVMFSKKNI